MKIPQCKPKALQDSTDLRENGLNSQIRRQVQCTLLRSCLKALNSISPEHWTLSCFLFHIQALIFLLFQFPSLHSSCKLSIPSPSSQPTFASFCGLVNKELTSYQSKCNEGSSVQDLDSSKIFFLRGRVSAKFSFSPHFPPTSGR